MPLDILKRLGIRKTKTDQAGPPPVSDELEAQEYDLKLTYRGKTSQGVRMTAGSHALQALPDMLAGLAITDVEVVAPLDAESQGASPTILKPKEALAWINANHDHHPITRHALMVLESLDAVDAAFETCALTLLAGETDTSGFPAYDAIVGGVVSHWDELTGDMIVRAAVGWGGKGVRGDTDRQATRLLGRLLANVLASSDAVGPTAVERPMPQPGGGGLVCAHCGFSSAHERAFYCPKCGMRMLRG